MSPKITVEEIHALQETRLIFIKNEIKRNPTISLSTLGDMCGISRERIRQILKKSGIEKSRARNSGIPYGYCIKGHPLLEIRLRLIKGDRCFICNPLKSYQWIDQDTGNIRSEKNEVKITCYACGKTKTFVGEKATQRKRYDAQRKHPDMKFCSKECLGTVGGKEWGWRKRKGISKGWKNPKSKSEIVHGPCEECGKPTSRSRVKKQYIEDPSVSLSYRNKHMFCSRTCMGDFWRNHSIKKLKNYIETNTTPLIKRTSDGSWTGSLQICYQPTSVPDNRKNKSKSRTVSFQRKTRIEVHKKLITAIREELRYRTIGVDTKKIANGFYSERAQLLIEENGALTVKDLAQLMNVNKKTLAATLSRNPIFKSQPNRKWKLISTKEK